MVGFDGSEMDDQGDGDPHPDDEIELIDEASWIEKIADYIATGWRANGAEVNILTGVTPGEVYLGLTMPDGIGISIAINYTE